MTRPLNPALALLGLLGGGMAAAQTATVAGTPTAPFPTIENITVEWPISGDDDLDGVVAVRYRPVTVPASAFQDGMPLRRIPDGSNEGFNWANRHSGSVFDLNPDTTYEIELTLTDPDGGGAVQMVTATTRAVPQPMAGAPVTVVTPATLNGVLGSADPGDVIELGPGAYSGFNIDRNGSAGMPIVVRGTPGAAITGEIGIFNQQHIILDRLTVNGRIRFNGSDNVSITNCTVNASPTNGDGIVTFTRSENAYIADNTVIGTTVWAESAFGASGNNLGEGIAVTGPGHVVTNNFVSGFRDNISFLEQNEAVDQFSLDILNNDLYQGADDGIEADFCFHNCRIMRNRVTNSFIAFSSQPSLGGPNYFIRNVAYNVAFQSFKLQRSSVGDVLLHNTVVKNGHALGIATGDPVSRLFTRNNLMIGGTGADWNGFDSGVSGRVINIQTLETANADMNFDALGSTNGTFTGRFGGVQFNNLAELRSTTTETDAVEVGLGAFAATIAYPANAVTIFPLQDLRLAAAGGAVDVGEPIGNVNAGFAGAAPDAGAYELGDPLPVYGPRDAEMIFANGFEALMP